MRIPIPTLVFALAASLLASCAPTTPQGRIEHDPARFNRLSSKDKTMVQQGQIRTGMSQDAVYLAWGRPHSVSKGESGGTRTERWTYTGQTPVWTNHVNIGYGHGYGHCGHYGGYFDYGPTITYIPYTAGVVHFSNGRVSKWENSGR